MTTITRDMLEIRAVDNAHELKTMIKNGWRYAHFTGDGRYLQFIVARLKRKKSSFPKYQCIEKWDDPRKQR